MAMIDELAKRLRPFAVGDRVMLLGELGEVTAVLIEGPRSTWVTVTFPERATRTVRPSDLKAVTA